MQTGDTKPAAVRLKSLVNLRVNEASIAIVELNDPVNFNSLSAALLEELRVQLGEVHRLVSIGKVRAMVLRGDGPHFCVGGGSGGRAHWASIVAQVCGLGTFPCEVP